MTPHGMWISKWREVDAAVSWSFSGAQSIPHGISARIGDDRACARIKFGEAGSDPSRYVSRGKPSQSREFMNVDGSSKAGGRCGT